jgi:hypothetical protein
MKSLHSFAYIALLLILVSFESCQHNPNSTPIHEKDSIVGSWKLLTGTVIKGQDTTVTDYTINQELIKIINQSHFAFLRHDLGSDSTKIFVSGGGRCEIKGNQYIEHLDFCNYREWENNKFDFKFTISNDTLITTGIEKIESLNVNQLNIEKYIRIK